MEARSLLDDGDGGCGTVVGIVERPRTVSGIVPCALLCCCDAEGFCCTYFGSVSRSILRLNDTIRIYADVGRGRSGLREGEVEVIVDGTMDVIARGIKLCAVVIFEDGFQRAFLTPLNVEVVNGKVRAFHTCVRIGSSDDVTVIGAATLLILRNGIQYHRALVDIGSSDSCCSSISGEAIVGSNNLCTGHRSRRVCPVGRDGAAILCLDGRYGRTEGGSTVIFCTISRIGDGWCRYRNSRADNNLVDLEAAGLSGKCHIFTAVSNHDGCIGVLTDNIGCSTFLHGSIAQGETLRRRTSIINGQFRIGFKQRQLDGDAAVIQLQVTVGTTSSSRLEYLDGIGLQASTAYAAELHAVDLLDIRSRITCITTFARSKGIAVDGLVVRGG